MIINRLPSGSGKGELHGASITIEADTSLAGQTVELYLNGAMVKSGTLSDDASYLFTDILEAGTYTAEVGSFSGSVEVSADDILSKNAKKLTIATTVTITLTLEGANGDNITVTDKNGDFVAVYVFNGTTCTQDINIIDGEEYTFTSSIAKDTTDGTSDYSKTIRLYADGRHNVDDIGMVPVMTSNTAPSGECVRSSVSVSAMEAYCAFDKNNSTNWGASANSTDNYVGYKFTSPQIINKTSMYITKSGSLADVKAILRGSNVGGSNENWVALSDEITVNATGEIEITTSNTTPYLYYSIQFLGVIFDGGYQSYMVRNLQFYTKGIKIMPEGALYWYGNECVDVTGGWAQNGFYGTWLTGLTPAEGSKYNNYMKCQSPGGKIYQVLGTTQKIDLSKYSKLCFNGILGTDSSTHASYSINLTINRAFDISPTGSNPMKNFEYTEGKADHTVSPAKYDIPDDWKTEVYIMKYAGTETDRVVLTNAIWLS